MPTRIKNYFDCYNKYPIASNWICHCRKPVNLRVVLVDYILLSNCVNNRMGGVSVPVVFIVIFPPALPFMPYRICVSVSVYNIHIFLVESFPKMDPSQLSVFLFLFDLFAVVASLKGWFRLMSILLVFECISLVYYIYITYLVV